MQQVCQKSYNDFMYHFPSNTLFFSNFLYITLLVIVFDFERSYGSMLKEKPTARLLSL